MISLVHGIVKEQKEQVLIVDIGCIGLELHVARSSLFTKGDTVELYTHLHWNQEQGPCLFGFQSETDRRVFQLVISCSGLGPKIGLAILNQLGSNAFLQAVQMADDQLLSKVNGIGIKKAEQMIVQLRHKVKKLFNEGIELDEAATAGKQWNDVINALESLSYSRQEINSAMKYLAAEHSASSLPFEQLMRKALAILAKRS